MKRFFVVICLFLNIVGTTFAQKFYTKNGSINFDATSPSSSERVEGMNRMVTCVVDVASGAIQFAVLMKGFAFERALMEEHFNENYVESHKFPKAEFRGSILNNSSVNYSKDGSYAVTVKGKLTIHGESRDVETQGRLVVDKGKINAIADFTVLLSDYNISVPRLVADKVSKTANITVNCLLEPLKG